MGPEDCITRTIPLDLFTADHSEESVSATTESPESDKSYQQNPSDKVELTCLNQSESPAVSPESRLTNADATPRKVSTETTAASAVGHGNLTGGLPQAMSAFSEVAESLRHCQLVVNSTQKHILKQQEAIQSFMETYSSSVSS